jgi:hypothetical protein
MPDRRQFLATIVGAALGSARAGKTEARIAVRLSRGFGQTAQPAARRWSSVQDVLDAHVRRRAIPGGIAALSYGDAPVAYLTAGGVALDYDRLPDENSIYRRIGFLRQGRVCCRQFIGNVVSRRAPRTALCGMSCTPLWMLTWLMQRGSCASQPTQRGSWSFSSDRG